MGDNMQVKDVKNISQAQCMAIVVTLVFLVYAVRLLFNISWINDYVSRHESILVSVKENHLQCTAKGRRDERSKIQKEQSDVDAGHRERPDSPRILAMSKYEKMLDMGIQTAQDNKTRFPITLFGFVITQALLLLWVGMMLQPLADQVSKVFPPV